MVVPQLCKAKAGDERLSHDPPSPASAVHDSIPDEAAGAQSSPEIRSVLALPDAVGGIILG